MQQPVGAWLLQESATAQLPMSTIFYATQMVLSSAALALGGHLMKKAYKWARHNPQAIGRGINTVSKMISAKHQGLGKFITGAARVAQVISNKDSFVNKMATAALKNESPAPAASTSIASSSPPVATGGGAFTAKRRSL